MLSDQKPIKAVFVCWFCKIPLDSGGYCRRCAERIDIDGITVEGSCR